MRWLRGVRKRILVGAAMDPASRPIELTGDHSMLLIVFRLRRSENMAKAERFKKASGLLPFRLKAIAGCLPHVDDRHIICLHCWLKLTAQSLTLGKFHT